MALGCMHVESRSLDACEQGLLHASRGSARLVAASLAFQQCLLYL